MAAFQGGTNALFYFEFKIAIDFLKGQVYKHIQGRLVILYNKCIWSVVCVSQGGRAV